mmetsp:Transcript_7738/g.10966  ORF Transcript_7738/g.10966 Transcript_7738/m.10966 type:complete len:89 (+) Transcript_7738:1146-1412(+)
MLHDANAVSFLMQSTFPMSNSTRCSLHLDFLGDAQLDILSPNISVCLSYPATQSSASPNAMSFTSPSHLPPTYIAIYANVFGSTIIVA